MPAPLPPEPAIEMLPPLLDVLSRADLAVGRLDGVTSILPNPDLFVGMYVRQEAVLSSQIEGTQASLTDVLEFELDHQEHERPKDVQEVVNYVRAMNHGLARLAELPVSLRLVREIHKELMSGVRGHERDPGEFRRTQNWIGAAGCTLRSATFIPPPPHEVLHAMGELESFWHERNIPPLIQAGLAHAQFETIHPFLDGNGRVGRLLITFMLCEQGILSKPLLYLSHFLRQHRAEYYDRLQAVRVDGHWEQWLLFFLRGVCEVATEATLKARQIVLLREAHMRALASQSRMSGNLLRVLAVLFEHPIVSVSFIESRLDTTFVTASKLLSRLADLGLVKESTGYRRNRRFAYEPYLQLFTTSAAIDPELDSETISGSTIPRANATSA